jgi:hypothetical protein
LYFIEAPVLYYISFKMCKPYHKRVKDTGRLYGVRI